MKRNRVLLRISMLIALIAALFVGQQQAALATLGNGGNVFVGWSISGAPADGLTNITFPMTVNPATRQEQGTYASQQYSFTSGMGGYTGLQPLSPVNGVPRLNAVFSVFGAGTSSTDPNCSTGADGGSGTSCGRAFNAVYGRQYNLEVALTGSNTWTGTVIDTATGVRTRIGTYVLPAGNGKVGSSNGGFLEYWTGVQDCASLYRADYVFGGPTTTNGGGLSGTTSIRAEDGNCKGSANFTSTPTAKGVRVQRGFLSTGQFVGSGSRKCLAADGSTSGSPITIRTCSATAAQSWTWMVSYAMASQGRCLDIPNGSAAEGAKLQLWDCNGSAAQTWDLLGGSVLRNPASGLCVDVTGGSSADGTPIQLYTCNWSAAQSWSRL